MIYDVYVIKNKGPWDIIFRRPFDSREEAVKFEKLLKQQKGGNGFKKIIDSF